MKETLAKALITRGILNVNSKIVAKCPILGIGHMPDEKKLTLTVDRIVMENSGIKFFTTASTGKRYSVPCEKVEVIDGMRPARLALAYDIKEDGNIRTMGAKRGRKPKRLLATE